MKKTALCLLVLLMGLGSPQAHAGRFRDLIENRMAEEDRAPLIEGARLDRSLAYGSHAKQAIDVYRPAAETKDAPLIFMVHGGGWRYGDKNYANVVENKGKHFLKEGYVFVSVNYRLLPDAAALEQADDIRQAIAFVRSHAASWGASPDKIVLMGHSAGAHLVALVAASTPNAPWLGTVVLDSGAMNLFKTMKRPHPDFYDEAFGKDPAFWPPASPQQSLVTGARPFLLVCSTQRKDDPCADARAFADKAKPLGVRTEILPLDKTHGEINATLGQDPAYTQRVDAFIRTLLSP